MVASWSVFVVLLPIIGRDRQRGFGNSRQIGLVGECVAIYRSESISMVATPLLGALGGVVGSSPKKKRRDSPSDPREKDAALLASIGSAGFPIR